MIKTNGESMKNIVKKFKQYSNTDDILKLVYGIPSSEHFDCVFVAPSWNIEKVFDLSSINTELLFSNQDITAHKITHNGKKYLYVQLKIGAPNMVDFCVSCCDLDCDKFIFIGSVGSLVPEINLGDIIIPEYSISGDGASLYLHDALDTDNMFKPAYSNPELNRYIKNVCRTQNINTVRAVPISVDSVMCEYQHLDEFKNMGANVIEMETATFFNAMNLIGKPASAVLIVSDNSSVGQHLIDIDKEMRDKYHAARTCIKNILLNI